MSFSHYLTPIHNMLTFSIKSRCRGWCGWCGCKLRLRCCRLCLSSWWGILFARCKCGVDFRLTKKIIDDNGISLVMCVSGAGPFLTFKNRLIQYLCFYMQNMLPMPDIFLPCVHALSNLPPWAGAINKTISSPKSKNISAKWACQKSHSDRKIIHA